MTLQRRAPLRRNVPLKSGSLRASAPKLDVAGRPKVRRKSKAEREFRRDVLARDVLCQIGLEDVPGMPPCSNGGVAVHAHHIAGRVGIGAHDASNGIGCCWRHHRFAHDNPALAYERGWMKHRNGVQ